MNTTTRVVMLSLLSVAVLAGCKSKAAKDTLPPTDTTTGDTGVVTDGTTTDRVVTDGTTTYTDGDGTVRR